MEFRHDQKIPKDSSQVFLVTASGLLSRRGENECGQHGLWLVFKKRVASKKRSGFGFGQKGVWETKEWQRKSGSGQAAEEEEMRR